MDLVLRETVTIAAPRERVFAFVTAPDAPARTFRGKGPIPGAVRSTVAGGGALRVGAIRTVESSDGSVVDEEIVELVPAERQGYRLVRGIGRPLRWLVRGAGGAWTFADADADAGTEVTWTFTFALRSPLLWPIAALIGRAFRGAMRDCLAETRRLLEG